MLFGDRRVTLRCELARGGRAAGAAVRAFAGGTALLPPLLPADVLLCLFLASLATPRGKSRPQREKPEKTQTWEAADGKLPAGSTFSVPLLQLIYALEGSSPPPSCEIQSHPRRLGSRAQTERGSAKAEIFDVFLFLAMPAHACRAKSEHGASAGRGWGKSRCRSRVRRVTRLPCTGQPLAQPKPSTPEPRAMSRQQKSDSGGYRSCPTAGPIAERVVQRQRDEVGRV